MSIMALSNHTLTTVAWYGVAVVKLFVINYSGFRTVRSAFLLTPILIFDADASILFNKLGWKNLETQRLISNKVYKSLNTKIWFINGVDNVN